MALFGKEKAKDPVCGIGVDKTTIYKAEHAGKDYYFCSVMCKEAFVKDPANIHTRKD